MKPLTALVAVASLTLFSATTVLTSTADAGWWRRDHGKDNDALSHRKPQVRGFLFRPGGHRYAFENQPFLDWNGPYGNYPNFDPRNFKERVFSDPRFDTTSPSAF
ncbi:MULTISPECIES: hypothetical protein [Rhodomicrobium]|uniref:hypothetical protein n=1 Tax=Rhodomicrobium TaxID=1068 RepID=UPI000F73BBDA|nr:MULTISPECIES: hypothetical protein [Rhodomicrobium]